MLEALLGIVGTAFLAMFGWVVQLGTRVSVVETELEGLNTLINSKFEETYRRLDRIEQAMHDHDRMS